MARHAYLGDLERAIMERLWATDEPQTVRAVYEALAPNRHLAYTTVMTVLQRLAKKGVVTQIRHTRAHRYAATRGRDEMVASLMVAALDQAADPGVRQAALVQFVGRVSTEEAAALREALAELESTEADAARSGHRNPA